MSVLGPLAALGILAYVIARHGGEIGHAAERAPARTIVVVTVLALFTLLARSEAVVACLAAMGNRPSRLDIHAASSFGFFASMLNHYIASPVRAALLRRLDRQRAPTIVQMVMADASTYLIEGLLASVLLVASASELKLAWWIPSLVVVGALCALAVALAARRRFQRHPVFRSLAMLAHSRHRAVVVALMIVVFACQIARTLIVLRATGLHPSLLQAAATFVAGGVLSSLFAGPSVATAGAPLIVFGHHSFAAAAASGLILSGTAVLAAALYVVVGGSVFVWRLRHSHEALEPRAA
jgi:hypothetical protein